MEEVIEITLRVTGHINPDFRCFKGKTMAKMFD